MLASNTPRLSICGTANALEFWHLPVSKAFDKPEYYIGQIVFHKIKVARGEILHPVTITGLRWDGFGWCYAILLPDDHPDYDDENFSWDVVDAWLLEPM